MMEYIFGAIFLSVFVFSFCMLFSQLDKMQKKKNVFYCEDYIDLLNNYINFEKDNLEHILELDLDSDYEYDKLKKYHIKNINMLRNIKKIINYNFNDKRK